MKKVALLSLIFFLAAGCSLFGDNGPQGVIKTVDGGGVWKVSNKIKDTKNSVIDSLSVSEMAFEPGNHEHIYLSASNGGFWRSFDSGGTWQQLLSKINAYDFYVNPQDINNILVAGIYGDHGKILRTKDGGATWEEVYNEASSKNIVNTITANPNNPFELYAALNSGVIIKSIDGGTNWFVVYENKGQITKLRYSRLNNSLYALVYGSGLYKSTDGGLHWTALTVSLNGSDVGSSYISSYVDNFYKVGFDDTQAGVIYVTTNKGLYKTVNDGKNWLFVNMPIQSSAESPRAIASTHGGVLAYTSIGSTVFKTLDGGKSWQTQSTPTTNLISKILIDPVLEQVTYAGLSEK